MENSLNSISQINIVNLKDANFCKNNNKEMKNEKLSKLILKAQRKKFCLTIVFVNNVFREVALAGVLQLLLELDASVAAELISADVQDLQVVFIGHGLDD